MGRGKILSCLHKVERSRPLQHSLALISLAIKLIIALYSIKFTFNVNKKVCYRVSVLYRGTQTPDIHIKLLRWQTPSVLLISSTRFPNKEDSLRLVGFSNFFRSIVSQPFTCLILYYQQLLRTEQFYLMRSISCNFITERSLIRN